MKRIALFLATNLAIVLVLSITLRVLGIEPHLNAHGLNLGALIAFTALMGFGGSFLSLAMSRRTAKRAMNVQVIETLVNPWLVQTVRRQAAQAGIGMPEVGFYESHEVNAFVTGMSRRKALIAVSSGLLEQLTGEEAEAVLGHEVAHAANGDMATLALIQGVVNTFVMFLSWIFGLSEVVLGVLASAIVMWFSRRREFRADRGGVQLARHPAMIAALRRLASLHPYPLPAKMAAFGIVGDAPGGWRRLFMTHPPLAERIAALESSPGR